MYQERSSWVERSIEAANARGCGTDSVVRGSTRRRVARRQLPGHCGAPVMADDMEPLHAGCVRQGEDVGGEQREAIDRRPDGRAPGE